jgi:hypothetical protein
MVVKIQLYSRNGPLMTAIIVIEVVAKQDRSGCIDKPALNVREVSDAREIWYGRRQAHYRHPVREELG